jgi:predicted kinase
VLPTLVIISGPSGSGKTTLAHELARAIPCPAVCRDEIKEGMVHATAGYEPAWGDALTQRTFQTFFGVLELLLASGVSVVAEAAFQDQVWRPNLEPFAALAEFRIVQCHTDAATATARLAERARWRTAHADAALLDLLESGQYSFDDFQRLEIAAPSIDVDTTSGYNPSIEQIVAFINTRE